MERLIRIITPPKIEIVEKMWFPDTSDTSAEFHRIMSKIINDEVARRQKENGMDTTRLPEGGVIESLPQ